MLPILLCAGLLLTSEEPAKAPSHTSAKEETHGASKTTEKTSAKKEEKAEKSAKPEAKSESNTKAEVQEAPKPPAPKPVVRKRVAAVAPDTQKRLAEAEAKAARLAEENARLQEEVAKAQGLASAPITTPDAALGELKAGNTRFVSGKRVRTLLASQDADLRATLAKGQAPFAIIVTCSDSRLMDNLIFDQELGRLFTIREAGNSPDTQGIASAEYAAEHLGSKLVVVMGHTSCGAIKAVAESHGKPLPGNLWSLQAAMAGLLEACHEDPNLPASAYYTQLAEVNAQRQAKAMIDRSEILRELMAGGKLKVIPALYDLGSGQVRFLELPTVKEGSSGH